jgi:Outer membrane lipoprotein-sorting protein
MSIKPSVYWALLFVFVSSLTLTAQGPAKLRNEQPPIPIDDIIHKFADKEKEFRTARANYVYRQDIRVQTLNANDRVTGEWHQVWEVTFDTSGKRVEKVVSAPASTLQDISLTAEDLQDFREIQPFVLTTDDIGKYDVKYLGKEKIDEIDCYVFDVAPKKMEKGQRYFQGQIWVDDKDLQIVKTYGKPVPDIRTKSNENLFPRFETYREQIDGKYWFPTYTRAVDTLQFSGRAQRMREIIKYDKYKKFEADVKLTFGDAVDGGPVDKQPGASDDNKAPALDPRLKQPPTKKK